MSKLLAEGSYPTGQSLELVQGDITQEQVDAIVNAANAHLRHGAGVAGAILRRGGDVIRQESDAWVRAHGPVSHAQPAWTSGGGLPAKYVIHAVGPVWGEGDEHAKLAEAVTGSLRLAGELGCTSIALPAISTGIFGYPPEQAAKVIFNALKKFFAVNESPLRLIRLVLFDPKTVATFLMVWQKPEERF